MPAGPWEVLELPARSKSSFPLVVRPVGVLPVGVLLVCCYLPVCYLSLSTETAWGHQKHL